MKKSIFKQWWLWVGILVVIGIIGSLNNNKTDVTAKTVKYSFKIGSKEVALMDKTFTMNQPMLEINDTAYIPIRFMLDALNAGNVNYDSNKKEFSFEINQYGFNLQDLLSKYEGKNKVAEEKPVITPPEVTEILETFTAETIFLAYKNNEVKADEILKGQKIIITGTISDIGKDIMDDPYITFKVGDEYELSSVQCFFKDGKVVGNLRKGQEIKLKGIVDGKLMNVFVRKCELID